MKNSSNQTWAPRSERSEVYRIERRTLRFIENRTKFIEWVFEFHNIVRKSQGKNKRTYSQIMEYYDNPKQTHSNNTNYIFIIMLFILTIVIFYLLHQNKLLKK